MAVRRSTTDLVWLVACVAIPALLLLSPILVYSTLGCIAIIRNTNTFGYIHRSVEKLFENNATLQLLLQVLIWVATWVINTLACFVMLWLGLGWLIGVTFGLPLILGFLVRGLIFHNLTAILVVAVSGCAFVAMFSTIDQSAARRNGS